VVHLRDGRLVDDRRIRNLDGVLQLVAECDSRLVRLCRQSISMRGTATRRSRSRMSTGQ
jgi:hypothetical protein